MKAQFSAVSKTSWILRNTQIQNTAQRNKIENRPVDGYLVLAEIPFPGVLNDDR